MGVKQKGEKAKKGSKKKTKSNSNDDIGRDIGRNKGKKAADAVENLEDVVDTELPSVEKDETLMKIAEVSNNVEQQVERKSSKKNKPKEEAEDEEESYLSVTNSSKDGQAPKARYSDPKNRGSVYISHIPHGFYEKQMRAFFSQFGTVTNLRLGRSKKTGKSRGYAFVEFKFMEVAKVIILDTYIHVHL